MSRTRLAYTAVLMLLAGIFASCQPDLDSYLALGKKYDVKILRDEWGVPHIFGKTDADTAFGLAYAHAEDDLETLVETLHTVRAQLASVQGKDAAPIDYMVQTLRIREIVSEKYQTDLSPKTRALCEGYAAGMNYYAALHPKEFDLDLLPIVGEDIVAGFVLKAPLFFGLDNELRGVMGDKRRGQVSEKSAATALHAFFTRGYRLCSNTFAVAPGRSADGATRLDVNSHQPWEGPLAWYEAHLHSEEGWDCVGGVFPGTPLVLHGHNRDLGWALTVNTPDLVDIYVLDMNPDNPNQYELDGKWYDLEVRQARIKVRIFGPITWTVKRECLWSEHHGPVLRRPHGCYAIKYATMGDIRQVEQWYRMNKAKNLEEFQDALKMRAIGSFNVGYADKEGNIYYLYNAALPVRAEGYDWEKYLPGDTSETLWDEYIPFDKLPQVLNPPSGFVQNCNSTPFQTTIGPANPDPANYSDTCGIETRMTNRALRLLELLGEDESITREEFYEYKFDVKYSRKSIASEIVDDIMALPPSDDPIVQEAVEIIDKWDFSVDKKNMNAAMAITVLTPIGMARMLERKEPNLQKTLHEMAHKLHKAHGRLDVPWEKVNRLRHGSVDLGLSGGPDALRAIYSEGPGEDGCLTATAGDSYIIIVEWDEDGAVHSESIHQFGSATKDEDSPHYADQAPLFAECKMKPVWLDEQEIRQHLEREYRPGEEVNR